MIELTFDAWARFKVKRQQKVIRAWLLSVAKESEDAMRRGMKGPHKGNVAKRQDGSIFLRSTPDEFPAVDSGALIKTLRSMTSTNEATVGTNMFYSKFLREGTKHMKRRRMSDTALRIGRQKSAGNSRGWVELLKDK